MEYYDDNDNDNQNDPQQESSDGNGWPNDPRQDGEQPGGYQPGSYSQGGRRPPIRKKNSMALASMLCGLFGVVFLFCCLFPAAILLGVAAIVLSFLSRKGEPFSGLAIAGLVLGILAVLLGVAECAYLIMLNSMLQDPEMAHIFDQILEQYGS